MSKFSLEVTPTANIEGIPSSIRDVSIAFLPGRNERDVIEQSQRLYEAGFNPVPHIPARSIRHSCHLRSFVQQLREAAHVRQVLIIGGSCEPVGDYISSLQLLETGLFNGMKVGIAGHPESTPYLSDDECDAVLLKKNQFADAAGIDMYIVSQWTLNPNSILDWLQRIQSFNRLPVHVGIPGPASVTSLMKFAAICGVRNSMTALRHQGKNLTQLMMTQTPDSLVDQLREHVEQFHVYPFGGLPKTCKWLETRMAEQPHSVLTRC